MDTRGGRWPILRHILLLTLLSLPQTSLPFSPSAHLPSSQRLIRWNKSNNLCRLRKEMPFLNYFKEYGTEPTSHLLLGPLRSTHSFSLAFSREDSLQCEYLSLSPLPNKTIYPKLPGTANSDLQAKWEHGGTTWAHPGVSGHLLLMCKLTLPRLVRERLGWAAMCLSGPELKNKFL